jgi:hypothetical protein
VKLFRRSKLQSSRGHVRVEQGFPWLQWAVWIGGGVVILVTLIVITRQWIMPMFDDEPPVSANRTWLSRDWTKVPPVPQGMAGLAERLEANDISAVYVEGSYWTSDNQLVESEHAAAFAEALRDANPDVDILLWLWMPGDWITQPDLRLRSSQLARKAVAEWDFDGVHLNSSGVVSGSPAYLKLLIALRDAIGKDGILSISVPPDRIPTDSSIPTGSLDVPAEYTWQESYKQEVGLQRIDEIVVFAHASGLASAQDYEPQDFQRWVAYQVKSYTSALDQLDNPGIVIVAVSAYDGDDPAYPGHDPQVETLRAALRGVKQGIDEAGGAGDLVKGIGMYDDMNTDNQEWATFREEWLER